MRVPRGQQVVVLGLLLLFGVGWGGGEDLTELPPALGGDDPVGDGVDEFYLSVELLEVLRGVVVLDVGDVVDQSLDDQGLELLIEVI